MKKTLVYGFGLYDEFQSNISADIIEKYLDKSQLLTHIFQVVFDAQMFEHELNILEPTHILGLGQTREGNKLKIESRAKNSMAKRNTPISMINSKEGEYLELHSWKLPLTELCEISDDAGTYVCNYSMWIVENWARRHNARFAFLHIPYSFNCEIALRYINSILANINSH